MYQTDFSVRSRLLRSYSGVNILSAVAPPNKIAPSVSCQSQASVFSSIPGPRGQLFEHTNQGLGNYRLIHSVPNPTFARDQAGVIYQLGFGLPARFTYANQSPDPSTGGTPFATNKQISVVECKFINGDEASECTITKFFWTCTFPLLILYSCHDTERWSYQKIIMLICSNEEVLSTE